MKTLILFLASLPLPAATLTVCASGCTATTLSGALAVATSGDRIEIEPGYDAQPISYMGTLDQIEITSKGWRRPSSYRVQPSDASAMGKIACTTADSCIQLGTPESVIEQNGVDTSTDTMTMMAGVHFAMANDRPIQCWGGNATNGSGLMAPITWGTVYYIRNWNAGARTFQLAASPGGPAIDITSTGNAAAAILWERPRCTVRWHPTRWYIHGLHLQANLNSNTFFMLNVGRNVNPTLDTLYGMRIEQNLIEGHVDSSTGGPTFGVAIQAGHSHIVRGNYIRAIQKTQNAESKGVHVINAKQVLVENNYIEGASIGLLTGGSDAAAHGGPDAPAHVSDITIRGNSIVKPGYMLYKEGVGAPTGECYYGAGSGAFYRDTAPSPNTCPNGACYKCQANNTWAQDFAATYRNEDFLTKNLLELKDCDGCTVEGNYMEGSFMGLDGGQGMGLLVSIGAGDGFGDPATKVGRRIKIQNNWLNQIYRGIFIASSCNSCGATPFPQFPLQEVEVKNNLLTNVGRYPALSEHNSIIQRRCIVPYSGADGMLIENNTCRIAAAGAAVESGIFISDGAYAPSEEIRNLWIRNNITSIPASAPGFWMDFGIAGLSTAGCVPGGMQVFVNPLDTTKRIANNIFVGNAGDQGDFIGNAGCLATISAVNQWAANEAALGYVSATNHRLGPGSSYLTAGTGSTVPGADIDLIDSATNGQLASKRINAIRRGSALTIELDDPQGACTVAYYDTTTLRRTRGSALSSTTAATVSRRTVSITRSQATDWLVDCGGVISAGQL